MSEGKAELLKARTTPEERSADDVRRIHQHVRAEIALSDALTAALSAEREVARVATERLRDLRVMLDEKQREIDALRSRLEQP